MSYVQGHPPAHGDNQQSLHVWDMAPEGGGAPIKLTRSAIDAKEMHDRHPERYVLHEPAASSTGA